MKALSLYALSLLLLTAVIGASVPAQSEDNILTNPGFETGNTKGWAHWCIDSLVTGKEKHSGDYSVRLAELGLPGEYKAGALLQEVKEGFSCGKPLYASCWIKADNLDGEAFLKLEFWDKDGFCIESIEGERITGTEDWTKIEISTPFVPLNTKTVKVLLQLDSNIEKGKAAGVFFDRGRVYFDDLYLRVVSPKRGILF